MLTGEARVGPWPPAPSATDEEAGAPAPPSVSTVTWTVRIAVFAGPAAVLVVTRRVRPGFRLRGREPVAHGGAAGVTGRLPHGGCAEVREPLERARRHLPAARERPAEAVAHGPAANRRRPGGRTANPGPPRRRPCGSGPRSS
ncbi:hypothetical protein GCM10019016_019910 [Streptomyces prasinosporus]|uniref:Uncharacterized protein n=1 Tax=Streptomyces prasinosporus TaxID=68256 RepID=A0ABP6TKK9_9ACTN